MWCWKSNFKKLDDLKCIKVIQNLECDGDTEGTYEWSIKFLEKLIISQGLRTRTKAPDSLKELKKIPDETFDLIFADNVYTYIHLI